MCQDKKEKSLEEVTLLAANSPDNMFRVVPDEDKLKTAM